jgi:rod shape determining protein RodA
MSIWGKRYWRPTHYGWALLIPTAALCAVGLATIYAIQTGMGNQGPDYLYRQLAYMVVGVLLMGLTLTTSYQRLGHYSYLAYLACFLMLVALVVDRWIDLPFVPYVRGSRRWIRVASVQIQPSELAKLSFIVALAWYLHYRKNYRTLGGLLGPFVLTLIPMALIKMQPDLGTTLLLLPVLFVMLYVAGARWKHMAIVVLAGLAALPLFWMRMESYQRLRVTAVVLQSPTVRTWLADHPAVWTKLAPADVRRDPPAARRWLQEATEWEVRRGYQLVRSKAALGSGGLFGQGWGQGTFVEYDFLPDKHNDFIFAIIGHQFGLVGCTFVLACYLAIILVGIEIATLTMDPFGRLLAVGISVIFAAQVFTNVGMTLGLAPITGMTLPFVSFGGSSLVVSFVSIGLLINVAQRRPIIIGHEPFRATPLPNA